MAGTGVESRRGPRAISHQNTKQHPARAAPVRSITSMKTTQEIVTSIDIRLRELRQEIKTLDTARSALDGGKSAASRRTATSTTNRRGSNPGANAPSRAAAQSGPQVSAETPPQPAPRPRTRAQNTSRPRASRTPTVLPPDRLESLLSNNGGLTTAALAEQASENRDQVLKLLREMEAAGRIRRTGQRRSTRWHAVTDEDRIRERAAELETRRKRPS
jgi:hypothetical protein